MGFAHYSVEYGPMSPHRHAEEIVFVLDSDRSYVRHGGFGDQPDALGEPLALERDMILHFPENEWHVFDYDEGGHSPSPSSIRAPASTRGRSRDRRGEQHGTK